MSVHSPELVVQTARAESERVGCDILKATWPHLSKEQCKLIYKRQATMRHDPVAGILTFRMEK